MENIKITTKLILTILITSLLGMLSFEMTYNGSLFKSYCEMEESIDKVNNKITTLTDTQKKLIDYILKLENEYNIERGVTQNGYNY